MAKLVILTQGLTGRAHELNVDRTTVGRVEDNMFQIAETSVSSHHCEVLLRGNDVVIKDLNSTNGTFINDEHNHRKRFETRPDPAARDRGIEAGDRRGWLPLPLLPTPRPTLPAKTPSRKWKPPWSSRAASA